MELHPRQWLIGPPLPTAAGGQERLSRPEALAVLSSDALSSVAYATQEIVVVLALAGAGALAFTLPITGLILGLMVLVTLSYQQTIRAYPRGGGSYRVASENLNRWAGLVAAAALSTDYALTVAVSVAAGVAAITSYLPALDAVRLPLCLTALALLLLINLRGVRASARLLSLPTYLFLAVMLSLVATGLIQLAGGGLSPAAMADGVGSAPVPPALEVIGPLLLMRAFSAGCAALTGIEAISDSVMVFQPVEWRHARQVLGVMALLLAALFGGISLLASRLAIVPTETGPTLLYQLGERIFGSGPPLLVLQLATLLILLLAANTAYADFPRLAAFLARDGFAPRQLALLGDRLVFSNGIALLSGIAALLLLAFGGTVGRLIPLYALGVFLSFTLSQLGMVLHWGRQRSPGWRCSALINGLGATATGLVFGVLLTSKFQEGAWMVLLAIPLLVLIFLAISRHYRRVMARLALRESGRLALPAAPAAGGSAVVVVVDGLHQASLAALRYGRSIASELVAVHVDLGRGPAGSLEELQSRWDRQLPQVPLVVLPSPYRSLVDPVRRFVIQFEQAHRPESTPFCTVVLPVLVTRRPWEALLHNRSAPLLRRALHGQGVRVVTLVGFRL